MAQSFLTKNQNLGLIIVCIILGFIVLGLSITTLVLCYQQHDESQITFSAGMDKPNSSSMSCSSSSSPSSCTSTAVSTPSCSSSPSCACQSCGGARSSAASASQFEMQPGAPAMSDSFCMAKLTGRTEMGEMGSTCAVAQDNVCVPGVVTASGGCQTTVQQTGWQNWGCEMPNTYLLSTSGPVVGATMGSCNVRPIGSSLQNHVGFFPSCEGSAPIPQWGREHCSGFADCPNETSCG